MKTNILFLILTLLSMLAPTLTARNIPSSRSYMQAMADHYDTASGADFND